MKYWRLEVVDQGGLAAEVLCEKKGAPKRSCTVLQSHSCCKTSFTVFLPHAEVCWTASQTYKTGLHFKLRKCDMEMQET